MDETKPTEDRSGADHFVIAVLLALLVFLACSEHGRRARWRDHPGRDHSHSQSIHTR